MVSAERRRELVERVYQLRRLRSVPDGVLAAVVWAVSSLAAVEATQASDKESDRLQNAATVLKEIFGMPEGIPQDLLDRAECVIVFPSVIKVAVGIGGSYGR